MKAIRIFPTLIACSLAAGCEQASEGTPETVPAEPTVEQGFADVEGGRLYYEISGEGEPVVLIHGNMQDSRAWDDQFQALSHSFRVIRYDVRGFGKSSLPNEGEAYTHHGDLAVLLQHLGVANAHIVGLSMGSAIAVDFVLEYPAMSRSLVAAGPWVFGFNPPSGEELAAVFSAVAVALQEGGKEAALEALQAAPMATEIIRKPEVRERAAELNSDYSFWHFTHTDPVRPLDPTAAARLAEISVPTLLVVGAYDLAACKEFAELLEQTVPSVRTVEIPDAGHLMNMEAPQEFNRVVSEFFRGGPGGP